MNIAVKSPPIDQLRRSLPDLPDRLRDAGRYIAEHEFDATTRSMRELAASARLQPAAFTRLAQAMGRAGWEEFRNELIEARRPESKGPFSSRIGPRDTSRESPDDRARQAASIVAADTDALTRIDVAPICRAAEALHAAPRIWISGFRSCRSVAILLYHQLRMFRTDVHLVGAVGSEDFDCGEFRKGDAVVVIGFAPYSWVGLSVGREARRARCTLIALADNPNGLFAEGADHCLVFDAASTPAFFHSLTCAVSISQTLAAGVFKLGGELSGARLRKAEARLSDLEHYAPDDVKRKKQRPGKKTAS